MSTQEKLEQKIFNLVYQWGRVGTLVTTPLNATEIVRE
jgi:hypothetical protein